MAFFKYARASTVKSAISLDQWDEVRHHAITTPEADFGSRQATAKISLEQYDPNEYLFSHVTIVASVDTESPNLPLGKQMFDGFQINRRFADFRITPDTSKYVNNNEDAWDRRLLLSTYRTFVGGDNFVEHIQVPELSKGKIIDAAARDIGESVYVDILVATNRKHAALINAITSGQLQTLSMGCTIDYSVCSKCGNVAHDETELCNHIRYFKGSEFYDEFGKKRRIAELCGHWSEPESCRFIEASWVANPAFKGAVVRNILNPQAEIQNLNEKVQVAFTQPRNPVNHALMQRAAAAGDRVDISLGDILWDDVALSRVAKQYGTIIPRQFVTGKGGLYLPADFERRIQALASQHGKPTNVRQAQDDFSALFDDAGFDAPSDDTQAPPSEESSNDDGLNKVVEDLYSEIRKQLVERVKKDIRKEEEGPKTSLRDESQNDNIIKSAMNYREWRHIARHVMASVAMDPKATKQILKGLILYKQGGWKAVRAANTFTGEEVLAISRVIDKLERKPRMAGEARVYKTVCKVGGIGKFSDTQSYLNECRRIIGRDLTPEESKMLVEKGKIFALGIHEFL